MIQSPPSRRLGEVETRESNITLLAAVASGIPEARVLLVRAWGPSVYRWCARLGGARVDAEDAAHDVLERVLRDVHTLRAPEAFPTWLFRVTRAVVRGHQRRAWLRRWVPGFVPDAPDPAPGPGRRREMTERARAVQAVLAGLPADLREVLVLSDCEERDGPEVAALLDLPLGTVKSRLRRARAAFARRARAVGLGPDEEGV